MSCTDLTEQPHPRKPGPVHLGAGLCRQRIPLFVGTDTDLAQWQMAREASCPDSTTKA